MRTPHREEESEMKLSLNVFVTLDGVMQGPGGPEEDPSGGFDRGGWLVPYAEDMASVIGEKWFAQADAVLLGRTTYELMKSYWPGVTDPDDVAARVLNTHPKYVVSRTLTDEAADWGDTTVLSGDVVPAVQAIKEQPGDELQVHGSWQLCRTLHDAGLVDVYRLLVFPTVVGGGKRLFADGATPSGFRVVDHAISQGGCQYLALEPTQFKVGGHAVVDGKDTWAER
jgi:dihydrofolate reductase